MLATSTSNQQTHSNKSKPLLSLSLITLIANASFSTIAPILPLECDTHQISQQWLSLIFLAYPIGFCVASPLITSWFESMGTVQIMIGGLGMVSFLFLCMSFVFLSSSSCVVIFLTVGQFLLGASMSAITTGYYSLATLLFVEREAAMSCVESAVGMGYIIGAILGSMLYDGLGYEWAYRVVSFVVFLMAAVTTKFLKNHLTCSNLIEGCDESSMDSLFDNTQQYDRDISILNSNTKSKRSRASQHQRDIDLMEIEAQKEENQYDNDPTPSNPTTMTLLQHAKITCAAMTILWISAAWCFLEPILAKRLVHFDLGKRQIGFIFALSNIVYVPTAFCMQYLPMRNVKKHTVIAISTLLTPIGVLLVGVNSLSFVTVGILMLGLFPTPVWIVLLPSMQEDASALFSNEHHKRCVNDLTAGIYNLFITLGQIVGYIIGPLVNQFYGVTTTTRIVAGFILLQLFVYCIGVGICRSSTRWQRKGRRRGRYFARYIL